MLYLEALELEWTQAEKDVLLRPSIEFNPPVRFLQSTGHKQLVGIELDKVNLEVKFTDANAKAKFKYLVKRTVIDDNGPSATASYGEVFADFVVPTTQEGGGAAQEAKGNGADANSAGSSDAGMQTKGSTSGAATGGGTEGNGLKPNALFNYAVTRNDLTLRQLMKEAKGLNTKNFPAAGSALLRSVVEVILKLIIDEKGINQSGKLHDLASAVNLVIGQASISADDTKILKEFRTSHVGYINLTAHATIVPNHGRLMMARDCIDAFVKRNI